MGIKDFVDVQCHARPSVILATQFVVEEERDSMHTGVYRAGQVDVAREVVFTIQVLGVRALIVEIHNTVHIEAFTSFNQIDFCHVRAVGERGPESNRRPPLVLLQGDDHDVIS